MNRPAIGLAAVRRGHPFDLAGVAHDLGAAGLRAMLPRAAAATREVLMGDFFPAGVINGADIRPGDPGRQTRSRIM